ncbi:MAG: hypothetical protein LBG13_01085 [Holosporales bacterium]|nr:hypothetical protein [Holosporales bacterium]
MHKNEKVCYNIIDTCSCGLSFLGKFAGLTRRGLVYIHEMIGKKPCKADSEGDTLWRFPFWPFSFRLPDFETEARIGRKNPQSFVNWA